MLTLAADADVSTRLNRFDPVQAVPLREHGTEGHDRVASRTYIVLVVMVMISLF